MNLPWSSYSPLPKRTSPQPLQEHRSCPLCGQREEEKVFRVSDFQFYDDDNGSNRVLHRVVRCVACGLFFTNPRYTSFGFQKLFAKAAMSYGHTAGRAAEQAGWLLEKLPICRSVVDVGCGSGEFLKHLPHRLSRFGLDVDEESLQKARRGTAGIQWIRTDFTKAEDIPACDAITLFHVLEHLPEPARTLRLLRSSAGDQTRLIVEVPVLERAAREQDQDLVGYFTVQHLTHFSKTTLQLILRSSGWQVMEADDMPGYNGHRIIASPADSETRLPSPQESSADLQAVQRYLQQWQCNLQRVQRKLERLNGAQEILVWGGGQHTEYLARLTSLFQQQRRYLVVDNDPLKQGARLHGIPILSPQSLPHEFWTRGKQPIVISTFGGQQSVKNWLIDRGVSETRIIALYERTNRY